MSVRLASLSIDIYVTNNNASSVVDSDLETADVIENKMGRLPCSQFQAPAEDNLDTFVPEIPQDSSTQLVVNNPYSPQPGPSCLSSNNLVLQSSSSFSHEATSLNITVESEDNRRSDDDILIFNPLPTKSPEVVVLSDDDESKSLLTDSQLIDIDSDSCSVIFTKVPGSILSQSEPDSSSVTSSRKRTSSKSSRNKANEGEAAKRAGKSHKHCKKCIRYHRRHHKSNSKKSKKDKQQSEGS